MDRFSLHNGAGILAVGLALFLTQILAGGPALDVAVFFVAPVVAAAILAQVVIRPASRRRFDQLAQPTTASEPRRPLPALATAGEAT